MSEVYIHFQINQLHDAYLPTFLAFLINDFWTFEFTRPSILEHNYRLDSIRDPFQALNYRGGM